MLASSTPSTRTDADVLIINTCSIREKAENKLYSDLGLLREWKAERAGSADRSRVAASRSRSAIRCSGASGTWTSSSGPTTCAGCPRWSPVPSLGNRSSARVGDVRSRSTASTCLSGTPGVEELSPGPGVRHRDGGLRHVLQRSASCRTHVAGRSADGPDDILARSGRSWPRLGSGKSPSWGKR